MHESADVDGIWGRSDYGRSEFLSVEGSSRVQCCGAPTAVGDMVPGVGMSQGGIAASRPDPGRVTPLGTAMYVHAVFAVKAEACSSPELDAAHP